ncbi:MAG: hypothetical protein ABIJ61_13000 [bacterium]
MEAEDTIIMLDETAEWPGRKVLLLNSRQAKRPCNRDPWVAATARAVRSLAATGAVFITSVGLNTWELLQHAVNIAGGRQIVLLPPAADRLETAALIAKDFKLSADQTAFRFLVPDRGARSQSAKWWWPERDRVAMQMADLLLPISLRPESGLMKLLTEAAGRGTPINESFRIDYHSGSDRVLYEFEQARLNPIFRQGWDYLTHWTRSCHGPLPGESSFDFYQDLISSTRYPRAAVDVLRRIVMERRLRASGRFLRAGQIAVAFTSQNPVDAIGLMRWRKRYVYYNFEPYGIAIHRDIARELGIRPVIYGPAEKYRQLAPGDRPYFQNQGERKADWLPEFELRHLGDLDFAALPAEAIKLLVYRGEDRDLLPADLPYEVIPLAV